MTLWHRLFRRGRRVPARVLIEYERTPDPAWQAMLDTQHIEGTARVIVAWEPGDRWQPIHRWMLWQLQPWAHVDPTFQAELQGPHPRSTGHYCASTERCLCPTKTNRWRDGAARLIDRRTWEIARQQYQTTGEWTRPRRLWVIQGAGGGHPFTIGPAEEKLRQAQGLPADVPSAGDLSYAEPDPRVLAALERYDLWRFAHGLGNPMTQGAALAIKHTQDTELAAHRLQWAKLASLSEEWADGAAHAARADGLHRLRMTPVGQRSRVADVDAAMDSYINDFTLEVA